MNGSGCCSPERKYTQPPMGTNDVGASLPQSNGKHSMANAYRQEQRRGFITALSIRLMELQENLEADYDRTSHFDHSPVVGDRRFLAALTPCPEPVLATRLPFPALFSRDMMDSSTQTRDEAWGDQISKPSARSKAPTEITDKTSEQRPSIVHHESTARAVVPDSSPWTKKVGGTVSRGSDYMAAKARMSNLSEQDMKKALSFQEIPLEERTKGWSFPRKKSLEILESGGFESIVASLILVDLMVMACLVQITGMHVASQAGLKYPGETEWTQGLKDALEATDLFFVLFYGIELIVKVFAYREHFVKSGWNWMDLCIVIISIIDMFLAKIFTVDSSIARVARIFRMMRISRISKICRGADSFAILVRSLRASVSALVWSLLLMCTLILIFAMIVAQSCLEYLGNTEHPLAERDMVYNRFGTFSRAVISSFEVAIGNWGPVAWTLVNNVSMFYLLAILGFKLVVGFAVLNVINAVFLRQTMKVAEKIDAFTIDQKKKMADAYKDRLHEIFSEIDTSGDGKITYNEFAQVVGTDSMKAWMSLLEIQVHELEDLFLMLDDGDGVIYANEFVCGLQRIKGDATAVDAMTLMAGINRMERKLDKYSGRDKI